MRHHIGMPAAQRSPVIEYGYLQSAVWCLFMDDIINLTEFLTYLFDVFHKFRELVGKAWITAITDTVDWLAHDGTSGTQPVVHRFDDRIISFMEGIREEIRKESSFMIFHTGYIGNQTKGCTAADTADHGIQTDGRKICAIRLGTDPVITEKHHCFLAGFMHQIHQLFCSFAYEALCKIDIITVFLCRNTERGVIITVLDKYLRTQAIAQLLFECQYRFCRYAGTIAAPVNEFFLRMLIENQREVIEEGCESYDITALVFFLLQPVFQIFHNIVPAVGLAYIKRYFMRLVTPVIGDVIIHLRRIPEDIGQKADGIFMERLCMMHNNRMMLLIQLPVICCNHSSAGTVDNLPPLLGIMVIIRCNLLIEVFRRKCNSNIFTGCQCICAHQIDLLAFLHVLFSEFIMSSGYEIRGIYLCIQIPSSSFVPSLSRIASAPQRSSKSFVSSRKLLSPGNVTLPNVFFIVV